MSTFTIKSLGNTLDTLAWFISTSSTNAILILKWQFFYNRNSQLFLKHKYNNINVRKTLGFKINQTFRMRKWALSSALCSDIKVYIMGIALKIGAFLTLVMKYAIVHNTNFCLRDPPARNSGSRRKEQLGFAFYKTIRNTVISFCILMAENLR